MYTSLLKRLGLNLLATLFILGVLRLGLYLHFNAEGNEPPGNVLLMAFYTGMKFDLRLLLFIHLPLIILASFGFLNPLRSPASRIIWLTYFIVIYSILTVFYMMDFAYYAYLETRLDASILRFLYNFRTSAEMVIQTYPVTLISAVFLACLSVYIYYFRHLLAATTTQPQGWKKTTALTTLTLLISLVGIWGKASWYPLRWSDAFTTTHHLASHVALNPVLYFFDTLKNQDIQYDEDRTRNAYPLMVNYLGIDKPDSEKLNYRRDQQFTGFARQPNIVVVLLESFAWYKTGLSGNPFDPTPNIDRLASNGISFTRYYAPHGGTARSVWALMTGLPDIEINKTSSRNPLIVKQHSIINAFKGYEKMYFIGGSASWANIRGLLSSNIPGLQVYEEGSYESPRMDVWGISDLHLFEEADKLLKQQSEKPFFAIIQTSGNHRPYNIPEDNHGFVIREEDKQALKQHGFRSPGDYNAMRFMDHSIGFFIDRASQSDYFKDTLFVFIADHGNMRHATHLPPYVEKLGLTEFQSPLIFYAPGLNIQPQTIDHVASQLDILPSIASFVSQDYANTTLGRNLFDTNPDKQHSAFTVTFGRIPHIGVISSDYYFTMYSDGTKKRLHRLNSSQPEENIITEKPETATRHEALTRALYETTNYMRFHNPPIETHAN